MSHLVDITEILSLFTKIDCHFIVKVFLGTFSTTLKARISYLLFFFLKELQVSKSNITCAANSWSLQTSHY